MIGPRHLTSGSSNLFGNIDPGAFAEEAEMLRTTVAPSAG
jgi:hypothetical protein